MYVLLLAKCILLIRYRMGVTVITAQSAIPFDLAVMGASVHKADFRADFLGDVIATYGKY